MLTQNPVKIPDIPGKIGHMKKDGIEYVRYLAGRRYNAERKYNEAEWVLIGRRSERMPGMMYPNDNYEKYFMEEEGSVNDTMTAEEQAFARDNGTYNLYITFFEGLYHEFKQLARKHAEEGVNEYKAESINRVLRPLKEMMEGEEYGGFLGMVEAGEEGMSYSDVMILLTQYKSALAQFRRQHF